jgi:hypothetical protein
VKSSPSRKEQLLALRQINLDGRRRPYRQTCVAAELVGLTRKAIDLAAGTSSCSSLSRFAIASTLLTVTPVRLTPAHCTTSSVCRDTVVSLSRGLHDLGLNLLDDGRHREFDADQLANTCSASAVSTPVDEAANSGSKKIKPQPGNDSG